MKFSNLLALLLMTLLLGASACSTTDSAQTDAPAEAAVQAENPETGAHAGHHVESAQAQSGQGHTHAESRHAHSKGNKKMMKEMCPMQVEGTTRELTKLDDAVAMEFTTTGDVDALRERVQKMADMRAKKMQGKQGKMKHGEMHGKKMHGEMSDEQRQMRAQMMQMMSDVTVETEEIDAGMRLKFTPNDAAQTDALYGMMQKHSANHGQCPMKMMGTSTPQD